MRFASAKVAAALLLSFANVVRAGDPAFCDRYTINQILTTGLDCWPEALSAVSIPSDAAFQPYYECSVLADATEVSISFRSAYDTSGLDSAGITSHTPTQKHLNLINLGSSALLDSAVVPAYASETIASGPPTHSYKVEMIHDYNNGGTPEQCIRTFTFATESRALAVTECNKNFITDIQLPGLVCDQPLTGLNLPLGSGHNADYLYATCVLPDSFAAISAKALLDHDVGAGDTGAPALFRVYNGDVPDADFFGEEPTPAVWTLSGLRPAYFELLTYQSVPFVSSEETDYCVRRLRFNLVAATPESPPLTDTCTYKTNQECLNHYQNNTDCVYDFPTTTCAIDAVDVCQAHQTSQDCNDNDCLWDSHLDNCLASLAQVNSVFPCSYWNSYAAVNSNPACSFHGCLYDNIAKKCLNSNETVSSPPVPVVSVDAAFVNPVIDNTELTLSVQAIVPFVYTLATPTQPRFPVIQVLFPSLDFSAYGTQNIPACSSYQAEAPTAPVAFTTTVDPADVNAYLLNWFAANNNFNFDGSELGQVAAKVLGKARVGSNELIRNITYDGENLIYNITASLPSVTNECAIRGASVNDDAGTRVYIVPLSYIEQSPEQRYNQITKSFTVTVPTGGVAAVGSTSAYGFNAFPVSVILTKGDDAGCLAGEAKMQSFFRIESYNVFDATARVGVFSTGDIVFRAPDSPPGPTNCYGETFAVSDTALTCDYDIGVCSTVVRISGQCRVLTTNGNAFKQCSYAKDEDRIADVGSDIPYDTDLDGLHQFWVYPRVCPDSNPGDLSQCPITTSLSSGYPEHVSAIIRPSAYADEAQTANDFQVDTGFLPTGSSALANVITGTINSEGVLTYSLGQSGLITVFVAMQQAVRDRFDLRATITTSQTRIIPYSATGLPMSTVSGYTGPAYLSYSSIRARVLSTVKDDYFASCGAAGTCNTLPACNGIIGCDGFSIPVAQLRAVLPAAAYQIVLPYRIGLLNGDGSTPIARRRLLAVSNTRIGTATFRFIIDDGGLPVIVDVSNTNGTLVQLDLLSALETADSTLVRSALLMGDASAVIASVLVFAFVSQYVKMTNGANKFLT